MSDQIFLIQATGELLEMRESRYDSEQILQEMLEHYPALLAGSQIDRDQPRRWLLISREINVPGDDSLSSRWSLDHLFVDQDGIPTLVEVKRSTDTRIRREVVGQMLDYAANSISYWTLETIRDAYEASCNEKGLDPEVRLVEFLALSTDSDNFWRTIEANLKAGRIRMLFVADHIPRELQRIIEFLNEQMQYAEVLGVEVKQYLDPNSDTAHKTIVPRVIGQTAAALQAKDGAPRAKRRWDEESFFAELAQNRPQDFPIAKTIWDWLRPRISHAEFGSGLRSGSIIPILIDGYPLHTLWTYGTVEICFQYYMAKLPFNDIALRRELKDRLNQIPGVNFSDDVLTKRPGIKYSLLSAPTAMQSFLDTYRWFTEKIEEAVSIERAPFTA